jgi:hypothetical protein
MGDKGVRWGIGLGTLAAIVIMLLPQGSLEGVLVGSGLSSVLPAAAPPVGTLTRTMLAVAAFAIILAVAALVGNRRTDRHVDDIDLGDVPASYRSPAVFGSSPADASSPVAGRTADGVQAALSRIETALGALSGQVQTGANADLAKTLRSVQALLRNPPTDPTLLEAIRSIQPAEDNRDALLARLDAFEQRVVEQLGAIETRLEAVAAAAPQTTPHGNILPLPRLPVRRPTGAAAQRISRTLADIRRSIDEPSA